MSRALFIYFRNSYFDFGNEATTLSMKLEIIKTDANHPDFRKLVKLLDQNLKTTDGDMHDFYHQFNGIDQIKYALIGYENKTAIACGAIKNIAPDTMEVKRMFVLPNYRSKGIATAILSALEEWASELDATKCRLETGYGQPAAIALYKKSNYQVIENYGQYKGVENSICFEKMLK